jgi:hypothetical protein
VCVCVRVCACLCGWVGGWVWVGVCVGGCVYVCLCVRVRVCVCVWYISRAPWLYNRADGVLHKPHHRRAPQCNFRWVQHTSWPLPSSHRFFICTVTRRVLQFILVRIQFILEEELLKYDFVIKLTFKYALSSLDNTLGKIVIPDDVGFIFHQRVEGHLGPHSLCVRSLFFDAGNMTQISVGLYALNVP